MASSNAQQEKYQLVIGAAGYRTKSDVTATPAQYLVSGSQNVLINESTDKDGDKIESRPGYVLFGVEDDTAYKIRSEFVWKTKAGNTILMRYNDNGTLMYYSEQSDAWETLLTGLSGTYPLRFTTAHNGTELLRVCLFVNHSSTLYEWSGAIATLSAVAAGTITINENIGTSGFLTTGTRSIRIKDSGGTWRETVYTAQTGAIFTVSTDLTAFTFDANALVVQVVKTNADKPAAGYTADTITTLQNHVYIGSHSSSVVYMSQSDDYTDFSFSSPRLPTEGWQFVLDAFNIGFKTNIGGTGLESLVMFAENDWIYRVEFEQLTTTVVVESARVKPIIVSSGQGAVSQELIAKMNNSIVFLNTYSELVELGQFENLSALGQAPISDPIKPDFIAASFTGGSIRFTRNTLYVTAPTSHKLFILSFRETSGGVRSFWQPPQTFPVGQLSDYDGALIGHSYSVNESYTLFSGTNDNGTAISHKAHFAYQNYGQREKLKNFNKYFTEMYISENGEVVHTVVYDYLGSKGFKEYTYKGTDTEHIFSPNPSASLGVNALGTAPLGGYLTEISNFKKYRRFKPIVPIDFYEYQVRYEMEIIDARFQLVAHGAAPEVSANAPSNITR
jgi:hypothetical protein